MKVSVRIFWESPPEGRGFSTRSVRRSCSNRGMGIRHNLSGLQLDQVVSFFIGCVGHTYGRGTLQGLLRSYGIQVSQRWIALSLRRLAPFHYKERRQHTYRLLNPVPYTASYYGEKLHLDQNEKLVMCYSCYSCDETSPYGTINAAQRQTEKQLQQERFEPLSRDKNWRIVMY